MKYIATIEDKEFTVEIIDENHITIDGQVLDVDFESVSGQPVYSLILDGKSYEAHINQGENGLQVLLHGQLYDVNVEDEREKRLRAAAGETVAASGEFHLKAPMPGLVVAIPVNEGDQVEKGDVLLVLESMKMQNELKAPRAGTIERIRVHAGDSVEQKQTMLSIS
ncbi:MAG: biotin/lipoyl-binding protein [Anaerolineales bacterium]|nr:biotin/lipoyl-binding protein [Anaerolineales bacterium]